MDGVQVFFAGLSLYCTSFLACLADDVSMILPIDESELGESFLNGCLSLVGEGPVDVPIQVQARPEGFDPGMGEAAVLVGMFAAKVQNE